MATFARLLVLSHVSLAVKVAGFAVPEKTFQIHYAEVAPSPKTSIIAQIHPVVAILAQVMAWCFLVLAIAAFKVIAMSKLM